MDNHRQKWLLVIVAFLALLKFVVQPLQNQVEQLRAEVQDVSEKLQKRQRTIDEVELMKQQDAALEAHLATLKNQFSVGPDNDIVQLMFQKKLEAKARESEVLLTNISWTKTYEGAPAIAELEVKYESSLKNLMAFHSQLSEVGFNVVTDELFANVIRQRLGWKKLGQVKGTLKLRIYYLVENG